jgi:hypothetical protein
LLRIPCVTKFASILALSGFKHRVIAHINPEDDRVYSYLPAVRIINPNTEYYTGTMSNPKPALNPSERLSLEKIEKLELPSPSSPSSSTPENGAITTIPIPNATTSPPKLDRTISWIGAVGLAFTISNSWMSYAATFGPSLVYGGGVTVLFALIIAAAAQWVVLLGVCEMASAIPSSGVSVLPARRRSGYIGVGCG